MDIREHRVGALGIVGSSKHFTFSVDEELFKVMGNKFGLAVSAAVLKNGVSSGAFSLASVGSVLSRNTDFDLTKQFPFGTLVRSEFLDICLTLWFLSSELIAGESEDLESFFSETVLTVHTNEFFV